MIVEFGWVDIVFDSQNRDFEVNGLCGVVLSGRMKAVHGVSVVFFLPGNYSTVN